jgi:hypothetical protein
LTIFYYFWLIFSKSKILNLKSGTDIQSGSGLFFQTMKRFEERSATYGFSRTTHFRPLLTEKVCKIVHNWTLFNKSAAVNQFTCYDICSWVWFGRAQSSVPFCVACLQFDCFVFSAKRSARMIFFLQKQENLQGNFVFFKEPVSQVLPVENLIGRQIDKTASGVCSVFLKVVGISC